MDGTPKNKKVNLFEGPEPPNPGLQIPEGEVDVFSIVSARRRRLQQGGLAAKSGVTSANSQRTGLTNCTLTGATGIEPGSGWEVVGEPSGVCDGTYNAICNRGTDNKCVLLGKQDAYVNSCPVFHNFLVSTCLTLSEFQAWFRHRNRGIGMAGP